MNGITNEAAKEGHDPIHHVEVDEERVGSLLQKPPPQNFKKTSTSV